MAETVILLAVRKIGFALGNEVARQAGAQFAKRVAQLTELQGSMGRVMSELSVMHDSICEMDIRNRNNRGYEGWLLQVRRNVFDIEDMVDDYLYLVGKDVPNGVGCCFYLNKGIKKPRSLLSLDKIASTVKEAERNLEHLSQMRERWIPTISSGGTTNHSYTVQRSLDLASDSRSLGEEDLVGIEDNKQTLIQWLGDEDLKRSVIVLHGMGGLGKTTLAATVYRKEQENFECHAWVSISQTYTRDDVLRRLIVVLFRDKHSVPSDIATMDFTTMQDILKNFLENKKYLIILDDVWSHNVCNDIFGTLGTHVKGSRIIITTRISEVAHLASQDQILTLQPLSEHESWELFCNKAFPDHHCPQELNDMSAQILGKCEGLPLAIVSIGSLLRVRDKTIEEWKQIYDQLSWELNNNLYLDHVRNVLHLSFIYLPTYLKSCFLYCSLFPEDYLFKRKELVRFWVAEGFVEKRGQSTLEEVAEGYLKELVHRNMLQLVQRNSFGRVKFLRMHDIVRELALDLCRRECLGVPYQEEKCGGESLEEKGVRRLVVHKLKNDFEGPISRAHHLRSIIALGNNIPLSTLLPLLAEKCRYMSVIQLCGLCIEMVPDAIGELFNLRHLGLRDSKVKLLPKSIEKLSNLMTLDLCRSNIQELPRGIVKLKKLRHLFAEEVSDPYGRDFKCRNGVRIPKDLGNLADLQTLQALEADDESIGHLRKLTQMRSLRIRNVRGIYYKRLCKSLLEMGFLSYLCLTASDENEVLELNSLNPPPPNLRKLALNGRLAEGALEESPLFQMSGHHLCCLWLAWSQLRDDPLPCLSRLCNLMELWLTNVYTGEQLVFQTGWFSKLKALYLMDLPNLKRLEIQPGAMASLQKILLVNLRGMTEVPPTIEFLNPHTLVHFGEITSDFLSLLRGSTILRGRRWGYKSISNGDTSTGYKSFTSVFCLCGGEKERREIKTSS